jgi:chromosome segregation ATPase
MASTDPVLQALTTLITEQARSSGELTRVSDQLNRLSGDVTGLSGDVTRLSGEVTRLSGETTRLGGEQIRLRIDMMERFERVENHLTVIREDIGVNMGRADRAHLAADNTRDEMHALSGQVQSMERRQRTLSLRMDQIDKPPAS